MESAYALYFEYTSEGLFSQYFDSEKFINRMPVLLHNFLHFSGCF